MPKIILAASKKFEDVEKFNETLSAYLLLWPNQKITLLVPFNELHTLKMAMKFASLKEKGLICVAAFSANPSLENNKEILHEMLAKEGDRCICFLASDSKTSFKALEKSCILRNKPISIIRAA